MRETWKNILTIGSEKKFKTETGAYEKFVALNTYIAKKERFKSMTSFCTLINWKKE